MSENARKDVGPSVNHIPYSHSVIATETNEPSAYMAHYSALLKLRQNVSRLSNVLEDIRLAIAFNEMGITDMLNKEYLRAVDLQRPMAVCNG